nr:hypothetical protein CFP56_43277 [Quercus suber]
MVWSFDDTYNYGFTVGVEEKIKLDIATTGASVGLLLLWTRRVVEKFDGAMGNYSVYVNMWVWWSLGGDFDMIPFEKSHIKWRLVRKKISKECDAMLLI